MRIERLDLTRYGRFIDRTLDFGPHDARGPDLHVVYGPNEAGKSTLFAAWLDLLFGEATRQEDGAKTADYAFLSEGKAGSLSVGARIRADGQAHELRRTFGRNGALTLGRDASGSAEDVLASSLRTLDRRAYRTMFSLDDRELEQGGKAVLASEGRLGELLFSSTAGLSHVTEILAEADADAARLYRKGARRTAAEPTELRAIEAEIEALNAAIAEADTDVARMDAMVADRNTAATALAEAERLWDETRRELLALERTDRALAADLVREEAERELAGIGTLGPTPPGVADAIDAAAIAAATLADRASAMAARRAELDRRRAEVDPDPAGLAAADALDALDARPSAASDDAASPRSRMESAEADLPRREAELAALANALEGSATLLGSGTTADPAAAVRARIPEAELAAHVRGLAARRPAIDAALAAAERDLAGAMDARESAADALPQDVEDSVCGEAVEDLARLVRRIRMRGSAAALRSAGHRLASARAAIAPLLAAAGVDSPAGLDRLPPPPPARLRQLRAEADRLEERARERANRLAAIDLEREELLSQIAAIAVPAAEDAIAARQRRDEAWAAHREALSVSGEVTTTAEAFERALAADDAVAARCLAALEATARRREKEAAVARLDAQRTVLGRDPDGDAREALARAIELAAEPFVERKLCRSGDLAALEDHAVRHAAALEARDRLHALEADVELAREAEDRDVATLGDALTALNVAADGDSEELAAAADDWHARAVRDVAARERCAEALARAETALASAQGALDQARDRDGAWRDAWSAALERLGRDAPNRGDEPDCAAVLGLIDAARDAAAVLSRHEELAGRVRSMRADRAAFLVRLDAIAERLGVEGADWVERYEGARARVAHARDMRARVEAIDADESAWVADHADLGRGRAAHERELDRLEAALGTRDPARMRDIHAAMLARDRAAASRDDALRTIRDELGSDDRSVLDATDRWELAERRARLTEEEPERREAAGVAREALAIARNALDRIGGDGKVARLATEREVLLVRMQAAARRALSLTLGIRAAERALHRYRQNHRSAMLERASDAFATMSCGAFSGLGTTPGEGGELLHATRPDGRRVEVPRGGGRTRREGGLSTGTRNQLYLALRIAGYHELARSRTPPPFICDDVLETFDDERSVATLGLLGAMAREGQVILLTHHAHLVDLARRTVPGVRCHDLLPSGAALAIAAE